MVNGQLLFPPDEKKYQLEHWNLSAGNPESITITFLIYKLPCLSWLTPLFTIHFHLIKMQTTVIQTDTNDKNLQKVRLVFVCAII